MNDLGFRKDLYQGAGQDYDRFRLPYPQDLIDDLAERAGTGGTLLDLACGTGQICFALRDRFAQVWAVDQEPDMIEVVRQKAAAAGVGNVRAVVSGAQELELPGGSVDLVAIGSAFHRLPRDTVAGLVYRWLRPGRYLALLWGDGPYTGEAPWQRAAREVMRRWRSRVGDDRVPAGYDQDRAERPDLSVLREAGFGPAGRFEFAAGRDWSAGEVAGYVFATSVLTRAVLGERAGDFEAELREEMTAAEPSGRFRQTITFAYELARRPE
ncbi:MAG: class I SAM-dependent methyltransferase [Streptosporangiaceae bacterium]